MTDPVSIQPNPLPNPGLNFAELKREGTQLAQDWSGAIWTDYNEHDPGVTTLEQLCYALTELSYRAEFPVADLLANADTGEIDNRALALFSPVEIFPVNPVTVVDYRKLLLDRVAGLANIWFEPVTDSEAGCVGGRYRVFASALSPLAGSRPGEADARNVSTDVHHQRGHHHHHGSLKLGIKEVYQAHRNLCEDIEEPVVLRDCPITVGADVSITGTRSADDILADIYFALSLLFAPEPKRHSLKAATARGQSLATIFDGPALYGGLFDDDQMMPRQQTFSGSQITSAISSVLGVASVRNLSVTFEGQRVDLSGGETVTVPCDSIFKVQPETRDRDHSIQLLRDGVGVALAASVEARYQRLLRAQRQRYDLKSEYALTLKFPSGSYRDVEPYFSIQNQYPSIYGIGEAGPPARADDVRLAQAKQLKGYLLPFEQLLADFFAQLAHVDDLFSITPKEMRTYFSQSLERSVPDVDPLLPTDYQERLQQIVASGDNAIERRKRFLDLTLALYAQQIDLTGLAEILSIRPGAPFEIFNRQMLLGLMSVITSHRGAAGDRDDDGSVYAVPGMLIKSRIELGIPPVVGSSDEGGAEHDHRHHHHHHHHHHRHHHHHHDHGAALDIIENFRRSHHHRETGGMTIKAAFYPGRIGDNRAAYIDLARRVVRRNTPAHIDVDFEVLHDGNHGGWR